MGWILQLVGVLVAGIVAGRLAARPLAITRWAGPALGILVHPLVAAQGVVIGLDAEVVQRLPIVGLQAATVAAATVVGAALLARWWVGPCLAGQAAEPVEVVADGSPFWAALRVTGALGGGVAVGALGLWPVGWDAGAVSGAFLMALVVLVGLELGAGEATLEQTIRQGPRLLWIPAAAIAGSVLAGGLAALAFGWGGLAAAAGMGWYSLTGPMVTEGLGAEPGALAFLACLFRELGVLVTAPWLVARLGAPAATAAAGATAMDTALPFLVKAGGPGAAVPAVVSGGLTSLVAPLAVAAVLAWAST